MMIQTTRSDTIMHRSLELSADLAFVAPDHGANFSAEARTVEQEDVRHDTCIDKCDLNTGRRYIMDQAPNRGVLIQDNYRLIVHAVPKFTPALYNLGHR